MWENLNRIESLGKPLGRAHAGDQTSFSQAPNLVFFGNVAPISQKIAKELCCNPDADALNEIKNRLEIFFGGGRVNCCLCFVWLGLLLAMGTIKGFCSMILVASDILFWKNYTLKIILIMSPRLLVLTTQNQTITTDKLTYLLLHFFVHVSSTHTSVFSSPFSLSHLWRH